MSEQPQHVDLHRKILLRKGIYSKAPAGSVYAPFIGDGDLAGALYRDRRIYGADIDPARVATAAGRGFTGEIRQADCDVYPFGDVQEPFAIADFDSYSYPYAAFRSFWAKAEKSDPFVCFFTDGQRQSVKRTGTYIDPDGAKHTLADLIEKRQTYNFYWAGIVEPWFRQYIKPWDVVASQFYLRGQAGMLYWGAAISKTPGSQELL